MNEYMLIKPIVFNNVNKETDPFKAMFPSDYMSIYMYMCVYKDI